MTCGREPANSPLSSHPVRPKRGGETEQPSGGTWSSAQAPGAGDLIPGLQRLPPPSPTALIKAPEQRFLCLRQQPGYRAGGTRVTEQQEAPSEKTEQAADPDVAGMLRSPDQEFKTATMTMPRAPMDTQPTEWMGDRGRETETLRTMRRARAQKHRDRREDCLVALLVDRTAEEGHL